MPENPPEEVTEETKETKANVSGNVSAQQTIPPREKTKSFIARFFVVSAIVAVVVIPPILLACGKITLDGYKDVVLTIGSFLAGPVGIIVNNYFKEGGQ